MEKIIASKATLKKKFPNDYFTSFLETSDEWIQKRTGIKSRYFVSDETTTSMAIDACQNLFEKHEHIKDEIGAIIVATMTPDTIMPTTATAIQKELNISDVIAFDINVACSGFVNATAVATSLLKNSKKKYALIVGSETMSKVLDFNDRSTCILFGDGAGAMLIDTTSVIDFKLQTFPDTKDSLTLNAELFTKDSKIAMEGRTVFNFAVKSLKQLFVEVLSKNNLTHKDIRQIIPHQANYRIIDRFCAKSNFPREKVFINLYEYGNTTAATIPIAMADYLEDKKHNESEGEYLLMIGFGGGLSNGYVLVKTN